jgi:hypothetical protein
VPCVLLCCACHCMCVPERQTFLKLLAIRQFVICGAVCVVALVMCSCAVCAVALCVLLCVCVCVCVLLHCVRAAARMRMGKP